MTNATLCSIYFIDSTVRRIVVQFSSHSSRANITTTEVKVLVSNLFIVLVFWIGIVISWQVNWWYLIPFTGVQAFWLSVVSERQPRRNYVC